MYIMLTRSTTARTQNFVNEKCNDRNITSGGHDWRSPICTCITSSQSCKFHHGLWACYVHLTGTVGITDVTDILAECDVQNNWPAGSQNSVVRMQLMGWIFPCWVWAMVSIVVTFDVTGSRPMGIASVPCLRQSSICNTKISLFSFILIFLPVDTMRFHILRTRNWPGSRLRNPQYLNYVSLLWLDTWMLSKEVKFKLINRFADCTSRVSRQSPLFSLLPLSRKKIK